MREQTERRVLQDEKVPAADKVVSIFEEHTDIIQTGGRETTFGHKVFLTCGKNLADARLSGGSRQSGGSGSDENDAQAPLSALRALSAASQLRRRIRDSGQPGLGQGTRNPRRGLCQEGSTESLRDGAFQLGLSAVAAFPSWNRGLHLDAQASLRCRSLHLEGLGAFQQYLHLSVLSFNLLVLARLRL